MITSELGGCIDGMTSAQSTMPCSSSSWQVEVVPVRNAMVGVAVTAHCSLRAGRSGVRLGKSVQQRGFEWMWRSAAGMDRRRDWDGITLLVSDLYRYLFHGVLDVGDPIE